MNSERILRVTNCFLLLCGYQLHWFECKTRRYRVTLLGVVNFILLGLLYAISFNQHFERSPLLQMLSDVSPFLHQLVRLQLLLGLKIFLFAIYEFRKVTQAANGIAEVLPRVFVRRLSRNETFAYFLLFSTLLICLCFGLYIAYELEFKLPPLDHIFIGTALFIPHFMLAGSLRFFAVGCWVMREELKRLSSEFDNMLPLKQPCSAIEVDIDMSCVDSSPEVFEKPLLQASEQLGLLATTQKRFDDALQRQLSLLIGLNNNCLLAGAYSIVYFESTWHVMFSDRSRRVFLAANYGIFVFIFWDYLCWFLSHSSFEQVRIGFHKNVHLILKQKTRFTKETRSMLKDIRDCLSNELKFKLFGVLNMNVMNFLLLQKFVALVIALIVVYHYLNDQIALLVVRLDEADSDAE